MNSKNFERFCVIVFIIIIIILIVTIIFISVELKKIKQYKMYNEAELDSAMSYLGLEVCTLIEGVPCFKYGNKNYDVVAFAKTKKRE